MNPLLLTYPNKSHRKIILIPQDSTDLAELIGIIFGDGGIGNDWQLTISVNSEKDKEYAKYIAGLIYKLFHITPAIRKRPAQNTLTIVASSINLIDYLMSKGIIKGNKLASGMHIPKWIQKNPLYTKRFIRGLIDTDGCLYIHKHQVKGIKYLNIGLCFASASENIINSVAGYLQLFNIKPHISKNNKYIYLYSEKAVVKYIKTFGSSNPRILSRLKEWRDARAA